jgi:hypothetical protein
VTDAEGDLPEFTQALRPVATMHSRNSNIYESINLIRYAESAVLSNSTFAWWGGILCLSKGGKVSLPYPFFKKDFLVHDAFNTPEFTSVSSEFD